MPQIKDETWKGRHPWPEVKCSYSQRGGRPDKVWLDLGGTKRLFHIHHLENFIHYGLDYVVTPGVAEELKLVSSRVGWSRPYRSPKDELPDGPGILPQALRAGMLDTLVRLHQRGFLAFHDEALQTRPNPMRTTSANMELWRREVLKYGDWKLTPVAAHLLRGAKAWLEPQLLFYGGALPLYTLAEQLLDQAVQDRIKAVCQSFGVRANLSQREKSRMTDIYFEHAPLPGTYWLKQEQRAEDHILVGAIWKILEPLGEANP